MMDERITLSTLVSMLSLNTGDSKKDSEDFIRELFTLITEALERGESIKVKGLGVFKIINVDARKSVNVNDGSEHIIAAHGKVTFIPCKEITLIVNEPFEMFRTVELTDEAARSIESDIVHDEVQDTIAEEPETAEDAEIAGVSEEVTEIPTDENPSDTAEDNLYMVTEENEIREYPRIFDTEDSISETAQKGLEEESAEDEEITIRMDTAEESEPVYQDNQESEYENEEYTQEPDFAVHKARNYYWFGVATGVVVTLIGVLLFWNLYGLKMDSRSRSVKEGLARTEQVKESLVKDSLFNVKSDSSPEVSADVPTMPSDALVYDTITKTRYLTTMAKDHYGNYNLWPYIYMENEKFLGHPDRIKPGTKVVVPALSKYGVEPKNPDDIEKAKQKGLEIYARYQ